MKARHLSTNALLALAFLAGAEGADIPRSPNYALTSGANSQIGGLASTSTNYGQVAYLSEKAPSTQPGAVVQLRDALQAQQVQVTGLQIFADRVELDEGEAAELELLWHHDDDTLSAIDPSDTVEWSVEGAAESVNSITGEAHVQTTPVTETSDLHVRASVEAFEAEGILKVRNVDSDDFGPYANDDVDDAWQVLNFGLNDINGRGDQDPDGDGLTNLEEFNAGSDPMVGAVVDNPAPDPETEPEVTPETEPEVTPETEPEVTPETEPEVTPETEPEVTPETEPEVTPETESQIEPVRIVGFKHQSDNSYTITFRGEAEKAYALQRSDALTPNSWEDAETLTASEGESAFTITATQARKGFFRIIERF